MGVEGGECVSLAGAAGGGCCCCRQGWAGGCGLGQLRRAGEVGLGGAGGCGGCSGVVDLGGGW